MLDIDFLTFGGGRRRYTAAARRLGRAAVRTGVFAQVSALTHEDLDAAFRARHRAILRSDTRGYGYWIWKPHLISQALRFGRSEFLLYADAGCTLNFTHRAALSRLEDYRDRAAENSICSFIMEDQPEERWTKRDLLVQCGLTPEQQVAGQRVAGVLLLKRGRVTRDLVGEWIRIAEMDGYHYLDDSPSRELEGACFVEHRHDQSILSCLLKQADLPGIADETYFGTNWQSEGRDFPVWTTRDFRPRPISAALPRRIRTEARTRGSGHQPNE